MNKLWQDLINSDWHDHKHPGVREDRIENPAWLSNYLRHWKIDLNNPEIEKIRQSLKDLRSLLQRMVKSIVETGTISISDINELNNILKLSPYTDQVSFGETEGYKLNKVRIVNEPENIIADIADSFADILVSHDPTRIKICENQDCLWVYYDTTKNRTKRWCESTDCGNIMKVRRFRERRKSNPHKK